MYVVAIPEFCVSGFKPGRCAAGVCTDVTSPVSTFAVLGYVRFALAEEHTDKNHVHSQK